jgi:hypothetical protein
MDGKSRRGTPSMHESTYTRSAAELKPALASIPDACKYLGDVSRSKFYLDVLPLMETVHIGTRHFVVVASIDRLIAKLKDAPAALPKSRAMGNKT